MVPLLLFSGHSLHAPFYADTRETRSFVTLHTTGIEAAIGREFAVIGQDHLAGAVDWRLGPAAAVFMGFASGGKLTFDLLTFDGLFGVPLDVRWGRWGVRAEWAHVSAHFADGIRFSDQRPESGDVGPYSREWVQLQVGFALDGVRPYAGLRELVHAADGGHGASVQAGFTADGAGRVGPYLGLDLRAAAEYDWDVTTSLQAGLRMEGCSPHLLRLGLVAYEGLNDAGQWQPEREGYLGVSLGVDDAELPSPRRSSTSTGR